MSVCRKEKKECQDAQCGTSKDLVFCRLENEGTPTPFCESHAKLYGFCLLCGMFKGSSELTCACAA